MIQLTQEPVSPRPCSMTQASIVILMVTVVLDVEDEEALQLLQSPR